MPSSKLWYVIFCPNAGTIPKWQQWAIRKHDPVFGHVALLTPITKHHAIYIDPNTLHVNVEVRDFDNYVIEEIARVAQHFPVLAYITEPITARHYTNFIPSCVTLAKSVMGIDCPAVTPLGLYRWLLKSGASKLEGYTVKTE